ncbi:DNA pilot protein [Blackfly microvirus SF02]|uniref:DNA pilot protein n=1 Tax=Blackfly microvirus SF02 TaxID=2576452 RepID=A0A4P8PPL9_9VIRU|nr:DNA pilot protein [Blackfly microvirus SF02]
MWPVLGGLISGGASLLGGMFSSNTSRDNTAANIAMQQQTNEMSVAEAQKNRDFTQQMSSTAYQRASQDMQSAGLNPSMMFGSGSAASTPGGSTPSLGTAKSEKTSPFAGLGDAASKVVSSAVQYKSMEKMTEEIANLEAERGLIAAREAAERKRPAQIEAQTATERQRPAQVSAQTKTEQARPAQVEQDTSLSKQREEREKIETKLREHGLNRALFESKSAADLLKMDDKARSTLNTTSWGMSKIGDILAPILNSAKSRIWR